MENQNFQWVNQHKSTINGPCSIAMLVYQRVIFPFLIPKRSPKRLRHHSLSTPWNDDLPTSDAALSFASFFHQDLQRFGERLNDTLLKMFNDLMMVNDCYIMVNTG
jgi:hypothetical protein